MMRWNRFGSSLAFAAVAAVVSPALWHLTGHGTGVVLTWVATAALYAFGLAAGGGAERRVKGLGAAGLVGLIGAAVYGLGFGMTATVIATTVALGWVRSRWLDPAIDARGIWLELAVGLGSIALGAWLMRSIGDDTLALAAGVWGYFLVQSVYWLSRAGHVRSPREDRDGFEQARRRLVELLDETV